MYHYQHQKNQIIAMENQNSGEQNGSLSDIETDEENEEGDYTVYECPGLASVRINDMEQKKIIKNQKITNLYFILILSNRLVIWR